MCFTVFEGKRITSDAIVDLPCLTVVRGTEAPPVFRESGFSRHETSLFVLSCDPGEKEQRYQLSRSTGIVGVCTQERTGISGRLILLSAHTYLCACLYPREKYTTNGISSVLIAFSIPSNNWIPPHNSRLGVTQTEIDTVAIDFRTQLHDGALLLSTSLQIEQSALYELVNNDHVIRSQSASSLSILNNRGRCQRMSTCFATLLLWGSRKGPRAHF